MKKSDVLLLIAGGLTLLTVRSIAKNYDQKEYWKGIGAATLAETAILFYVFSKITENKK